MKDLFGVLKYTYLKQNPSQYFKSSLLQQLIQSQTNNGISLAPLFVDHKIEFITFRFDFEI